MKIKFVIFFSLFVFCGISQQNYEKAKALFEKYYSQEVVAETEVIEEEIINLAPNSEFAIFIRSWWLYEDELCKDALFLSDSLIANFPNFAPGFYAHGSFLNNCKNDFSNAKYYFEKCIELNPDFSNAYRNLGITFFNLDDYEKAEIQFSKSLELSPDDSICLQYRGMNLFLLGKTMEAYKILKSIKDENVYISDYYYYMGWCELEFEQYPDALISFSQGIEADPEDEAMLCGHGWAQMYLGNDSDAQYDFEQSILLDSTYTEAWLGLGTVSYYLGKYDKSIFEMEKVIALDPKDSEAWFYKGSALYEKELYKEASEAFTQSIQLDDTDAFSYFFRGTCNFMLKEESFYDSIIYDFEKAITLQSADADSYYNMSLILFDSFTLTDLAIAALTLAIEMEPEMAEAYYLRGVIYDSIGNEKKACDEWKKSSELGYKKAIKDFNKYCK